MDHRRSPGVDPRQEEVARLHQQLVRVYDRVRQRVIDGVKKRFAAPPYEVDPDVIARLDQRWKTRVDERLEQMASIEIPSSERGNEERDIVHPLYGSPGSQTMLRDGSRDCRERALPRTGFKSYDLRPEVRLAPVRDGSDEPAAKRPRVLPPPAAAAAEQHEDIAAYARLGNLHRVTQDVQDDLAAESTKRAGTVPRRVASVAERYALEGGPAVGD
jgi:hypothetical protein